MAVTHLLHNNKCHLHDENNGKLPKKTLTLAYCLTWLSDMFDKLGRWHQKQVSQAWISNCIPQKTAGCNYLSLPEIPTCGTKVFKQATGLDAWASRVKCPTRFVSHLHEICICELFIAFVCFEVFCSLLMVCLLCFVWASGRVGVNSIPIPIREMELELKLVELKMELELKTLELELKTGIEFFATATTAFTS